MLKSHLPSRDAVIPVFAVIAFLVYGWTMVVFLWKLPSWILFLTLDEILAVFAYSMVSALLESLAALAILLLACLILPSRWLQDVFVTRGTTAALFGLGSMMLYMYRFAIVGDDLLLSLPLWSLAGLLLTLLTAFLSPRLRVWVHAAAWFSDRLTIFLYLFLPLSLVSLLIVIYRNIF